jgi:hypothetical protein
VALKKRYLKVCDIGCGKAMKRAEVIALLKEITADGDIIPNWVSLVNAKSDDHELHIKSERGTRLP